MLEQVGIKGDTKSQRNKTKVYKMENGFSLVYFGDLSHLSRVFPFYSE